MLGEILGLFKCPVTTLTKKAEERNIKKELIIALVIVLIIAILSTLTSYISISKTVNKMYPSLDEYNDDHPYSELTRSEFKEEKKDYKDDLLDRVGLVGGFFKTLAISAVSIALVAGMLFVIARMVKSPKDYLELFAMTNGAFMVYILGYILNAIFMYIYSPIGVILQVAALVYAIVILSNAFRESIQVEDANKYAIYSSIVLIAVFTILIIIGINYVKSLASISNILSLL